MRKYILCLSILINQISIAGQDSGGGLIISAEFGTTARRAIEILSHGDNGLNFLAILETVKDIKIIPVDEICYTEPIFGKKYCEDAHYDKTHNIVLLAFKRWDDLQCPEKLVLSSHELLRAAGLEGEDYKFSGRFMTGEIAQCSGGTPADQIRCSDLSVRIRSEIGSLCESLRYFSDRRRLVPAEEH